MKKYISIIRIFVFVILSSIVYFGCEKKAEEPKDKDKTDNLIADTTLSDSEPIVQEPAEETKITIPNIAGKWTGTFDKRSTVFTITEQTDSSFTGKISISYREVINQDVKGTLSPTSMRMSMTDLLHSRYQGKYNGRLSDDGKNYSGTFTMNLDDSKFSFNLNKK